MAFLDINHVNRDVEALVERLEKTQWVHYVDKDSIAHLPIMTRDDLRRMKMAKGLYQVKTSGSTGEPVCVEKTYADYIWFLAASIRELRWKGWDATKNIAIIAPKYSEQDKPSWGIPQSIAPIQGKAYLNGLLTVSRLQAWLEEKNPHYICGFPSLLRQIDLSKIPNFIDWKGTGEMGGSLYSSEECGSIAITCPDNPSVMHVMENLIIEQDVDGSVLITSLTNPYIKRYKHGDYIEMGQCSCGRTLQTITKIKGRVRGMFVLPNGDKKWPLIGSKSYYEQFGIKQFKAIQTSLNHLELQIVSPPLGEREEELIGVIQSWLEVKIPVTITYVEGFSNYKHEEFVSLVGN